MTDIATPRAASLAQLEQIGRLIAGRDKSYLAGTSHVEVLFDVMDGKPVTADQADALHAALQHCPVITPTARQYDDEGKCIHCGADITDTCDPLCRYA